MEQPTVERFNQSMKRARPGKMGRELAAQRAAAHLPDGVPGINTGIVRRLEGDHPAITELDANPWHVRALALVYGTTAAKLSPLAFERLEQHRDLLVSRLGCIAA